MEQCVQFLNPWYWGTPSVCASLPGGAPVLWYLAILFWNQEKYPGLVQTKEQIALVLNRKGRMQQKACYELSLGHNQSPLFMQHLVLTFSLKRETIEAFIVQNLSCFTKLFLDSKF